MPRVRLAALLALALACLLNAGVARAGFAPAFDPIATAPSISGTGIATAPDGGSVIVWNQLTTPAGPWEAKARRLSVAGALGPVLDLAPGEIGFFPAIATTASGRAFAAWRHQSAPGEEYGVKGRWIEPDGTLGPLLTLAVGGDNVMDAIDVRVAIAATGVATVAWQNSEDGDKLALRRIQPDSTPGPFVPDISGGGGISDPQIAALPNGSTVAVWEASQRIEKSVVSPALAVSGPVAISGPLAGDPQIATDLLGNGLVVWREGIDEYAVSGRRLTPNGAIVGLTAQVIDPPAESLVNGVRVTADSSGDFLVSWNRNDANLNSILYARGLNSAGAFAGPAQPFSEASADGTGQEVALDDFGTAAATWTSNAGSAVSILGRTLDRAGVPTAGVQVLAPGFGGDSEVASVPATGFAAFLFEHQDASQAYLSVRRFMPAPACADVAAGLREGLPVAVPISCTGLAVEGAQALAAPQHGSLAPFDPATRSFLYTPEPGFEGTDRFTYAGLNDGGPSAPATATITVGKETRKPVIEKLKLLRKRSGGGKLGFKLLLVLSEPATAKVTLKQTVRVRGKQKLRRIGRLSIPSPQTRATVPLRGKLARKLRAGGRFRAVAVATDLADNVSAQKKIRFRVRG